MTSYDKIWTMVETHLNGYYSTLSNALIFWPFFYFGDVFIFRGVLIFWIICYSGVVLSWFKKSRQPENEIKKDLKNENYPKKEEEQLKMTPK